MYQLNGRPVTNVEVAGIDRCDYPDFCDAHVESAVWEDTSQPLEDADLEQLSADEELMEELIQDYLQGQAEYLR